MKILFCGGGTAGHITPNLAICTYLKSNEANKSNNNDLQLYYVGGTERDRQLVEPFVRDGTLSCYEQIQAYKLIRSLTLSNLLLPFRLAKSVKQAEEILQKICPDVVFSKGGYVGLPVVIAAHKLKICTLFHESDMSLGLANRMCMHFADEKLSTFPIGKKTKAVGLPIRQGLKNGNKKLGLSKMGFDGRKPVLLVLGGSLGAASLNEAVAANKCLAEKFDVFVLTGKGKRVNCSHVRQTEYVDDPSDYFAAADVCLTRAGSTTLCELTLCRLPFVAVPLQNCSRGEQKQNADYFATHGCGMVLKEENLVKMLSSSVEEAYVNQEKIKLCQDKLADKVDGTECCAKIILDAKKI